MPPPHGRGWCARAARAALRVRVAVGGGVSATFDAKRTFQPVFSWICSRVTPGVDGDDGHLLGLRIGLEHRQIGDQLGRALGLDAELGAAVAARDVADRGDEIELVDEAALALRHDDENLAAGGGDLRRAAAAGQPHLRLVVGADHRGVEIGVFVDLRAAEKADLDAAALQPVAEHFRHRHRRQRGLAQFAVADRERQHVRLGGERAGFVDQRDVRRMRQAREIAGGRGLADADETDVVVLERARRRDGHHLVRLVVGHGRLTPPPRELCAHTGRRPRDLSPARSSSSRPGRCRARARSSSHFL